MTVTLDPDLRTGERANMRFLALSSAALSIALFSCDEEIRNPPFTPIEQSLLDQLNAEGLTEFVSLMEKAGLSALLTDSTTQMTVFAPTNSALGSIPAEVRDDPAALAPILLFHMVPGRNSTKLLAFTESLRTAAGGYVGITASGSSVTLTGDAGSEATVQKADVQAFNGLVFSISAVLTPTLPPGPGTVVEVATEEGFASFAAAVVGARLDDDLSADGAFYNVLAPNEDAFAAFTAPPSADILQNIILHHTILGDIPTASIAEGAELPTAAGTIVVVPPLGDRVGLETNNGTLTEVTAVAIPPTTVEFLGSTADTSSLAAVLPPAIETALTPDTIMGDEPVTLFAPINDAFTSSIAPGALLGVMQHHVVMGHVPTSSLTDGLELVTLNGTLTVNVDGSGAISVTDGSGNTANVVRDDIRTLSGVVHLIDQILRP
jgi:transforming growth factor-beta-induced protein